MRLREVKEGMKVEVYRSRFPQTKKYIGQKGTVKDICFFGQIKVTLEKNGKIKIFRHFELKKVEMTFLEHIKDIGYGIIRLKEENQKLKKEVKQLRKELKICRGRD